MNDKTWLYLLRLPRELKARISRESANEHISMAGWIKKVILKALEKQL